MPVSCRSPQEILDDEIILVLEKCEYWLSRIGQPRTLEPESIRRLREYCLLWKVRAEDAVATGDQTLFRPRRGTSVSPGFVFEWGLARRLQELPLCYF